MNDHDEHAELVLDHLLVVQSINDVIATLAGLHRALRAGDVVGRRELIDVVDAVIVQLAHAVGSIVA